MEIDIESFIYFNRLTFQLLKPITEFRQLTFRQMSPEMDIVGQAIRNYLISHCNDESMDLSHEFNCMVAIGYWGKKFIPAHRDQRYDRHGNFVTDQNCQKRYSPTCILAIGDTRRINYS